MKITRIKTKLLVILLPCLIVSFGIISGISTYIAKSALSKSIDETAMAVGTDYANRVRSYVQEALVQQEDFASMPQLRLANDQEQLVKALENCKNQLKILESAVFIYPDGSAVRSDGTTVNLGDRDYFKKVLEEKKPVVSDLIVSRTTGKAAFNVAVPVMDNGQLKGALTGSFGAEKLVDLIKDLKFLDTGYGVIMDESGIVLAHPHLPEVIGKLNLSEKKVDSELKLKNPELDDRLITLFNKSVESKNQVRGLYTFEDDVMRTATFTSIDLPEGGRWILLVTATQSESNQAITEMNRVMAASSLGCIILAVVVIIIISWRISKPIISFRDVCIQMAKGDLRDSSVKVLSNDEIGQAEKSLQEMRSGLRVLISNVLSKAEQVAASSEELTAVSQQSADAANQVAGSIAEIAHGAETQADSANRLTDVAQDMLMKVEYISEASKKVRDIAVNTSKAAGNGSLVVEQTVAQMSEIEAGSASVQTAINELSKGSSEIDEIVDLISDIAGQTNLLALNAAIEAARAGEHGRGFAVVAEEIRKLAEESNKSAKKISELIKKNQENMDQAVAATKAGSEGVQTGISLVYSTGETFKNIVNDILQLSDKIEDISSSINQMTESTQTLTSLIVEIDNVSKESADEAQNVSAATEEQSASMQEIASASHGLSSLAGELQSEVAKFQV